MKKNEAQCPMSAKTIAHWIWGFQRATRGTMGGFLLPIVTITCNSSFLLYIWSEGAAHDPMLINQYSFEGSADQIVKKANYERYRQAFRENRVLGEYLSYEGQKVMKVIPSWQGKKCDSFMNPLRALAARQVDHLDLLLKISEEGLVTGLKERTNYE
jgi:hypothetical protein